MAGLYLMLAVILFIIREIVVDEEWWPHTFFCLTSVLIPLLSVKLKCRGDLNHILYDHRIVFLCGYIFFCVVGASLQVFGGKELVSAQELIYPTNLKKVIFLDVVNSLGVGLVIFFSSIYTPKFIGRLVRSIVQGLRTTSSTVPMYVSGSLGIGALAYIWLNGTSDEQVISGFWFLVAKLALLSIFLGESIDNKQRIPKLFSKIIVVTHVAIGLAMLNKTNVVFPVAVMFLAKSVKRKSALSMLIAFASSVLILSALGAPVLEARAQVAAQTMTSPLSGLEYLHDYFLSDSSVDTGDEYSLWSRINYVNVGVAAIDLYDTGRGGEDFDKILWLFAPRLFFPEKPVITDTGSVFYTKLTGYEGTSFGMSLFANGYYNLGFLGVVLVGVAVGLIVTCTSTIAKEVVRFESFLLYPLVFLGISIGYQVNGAFVSDYLGNFIALALIGFVLRIAAAIRLS